MYPFMPVLLALLLALLLVLFCLLKSPMRGEALLTSPSAVYLGTPIGIINSCVQGRTGIVFQDISRKFPGGLLEPANAERP